ncbi:hypothetical protein J2S43_002722 [Catenuloplanes nepalensis]|uniref:Trypsin-co-occurring domain-containing protein n=1 Tax=Catenuloplanes nepalensis TaxID=587533 RepID=A0ABT9MRZ6_9ACTN|nr:CU044_2847 family protein [Catenuloplanes nepalensis]MDP9794210.1 hypothetical protein [Catenuloplanes nepalensis]
MTQLLRFPTADGQVVVEVSETEPGVRPAGRTSGTVTDVGRRFEDALAEVRDAAASALDVFRDGRLNPDEVTITFGVRLNAEAGAVIAKTTVEGHLTVQLRWGATDTKPE